MAAARRSRAGRALVAYVIQRRLCAGHRADWLVAPDATPSRKYKNVAAGGDKVSLIVDSLASVDPMDPVAVKIHGTASIEQRNGKFGPMEYIVVRPQTSWSWGVEGPAFVDGEFRANKTIWR
jgi:hypothetical protein